MEPIARSHRFSNFSPSALDDTFLHSSPSIDSYLKPIAASSSFLPGESVFLKDDIAKKVLIHSTGIAMINLAGDSDEAMLPSRPGNIFGLAEILAKRRFSFGLRTVSLCGFLVIPASEISAIFGNNPRFGTEITIELAALHVKAVNKIKQIQN